MRLVKIVLVFVLSIAANPSARGTRDLAPGTSAPGTWHPGTYWHPAPGTRHLVGASPGGRATASADCDEVGENLAGTQR